MTETPNQRPLTAHDVVAKTIHNHYPVLQSVTEIDDPESLWTHAVAEYDLGRVKSHRFSLVNSGTRNIAIVPGHVWDEHVSPERFENLVLFDQISIDEYRALESDKRRGQIRTTIFNGDGKILRGETQRY